MGHNLAKASWGSESGLSTILCIEPEKLGGIFLDEEICIVFAGSFPDCDALAFPATSLLSS